jgi:hypothetical protein
MEQINKKYNEKLLKIAHYKKHPQMIPFVGKSWGKVGKMLVIGESHFLNDNDKNTSREENKKIWENWYKITSKILTKEQKWVTSTAPLIDKMIYKMIPGEYYSSWGIWRNIRDTILETGFNPDPNNSSKILCYTAFMNFFQRPALESGKSILSSDKDKEVANETLKGVVDIIKADYLFFVSSKAWENIDKELLKELLINNVEVGHSCHPTCKWWNRKSKKYTKPNRKDKITGKESFKYFISKNKIFKDGV